MLTVYNIYVHACYNALFNLINMYHIWCKMFSITFCNYILPGKQMDKKIHCNS